MWAEKVKSDQHKCYLRAVAGFGLVLFLINCTTPMSALTGSSRKHNLPVTWYLREVEKTWRAHQTLLQPSCLISRREGADDSPGMLSLFMPILGILPQPWSKSLLPVPVEFWGSPKKIIFTSGHPNYTSAVLLLTSWIKERLLSCWSNLTDTQGQPRSTSWLGDLTSISSWLPDFLLQTERVFLHSFFLTFYQQLLQPSVA